MRNYSLATHSVTISLANNSGNLTLGNGSSLDTISVARDNENVSFVVSADGEYTANVNLMKSGTLTLDLQQTTSFNNVLLYLYEQQLKVENKDVKLTPATVTVKDSYGNVNVTLTDAYITKPADYSAGRESGNRSWVIKAGKVEYNDSSATL